MTRNGCGFRPVCGKKLEAEELIKVSREKKQKRQHGQEEKIFTLGESMSIVPIKLSSRDSEALALVAIKAAAMNLDILFRGYVGDWFLSG